MFKRWVVITSIAWLTQLLPTAAFGFQQGELLPPKVQQKLGLNPDELTIVSFFAEWSVPSREELPEIETLSRQLSGRGVSIIGVDVDEDTAVGLAFQQELGLTFRVIADSEQELVTDFEPTGMPALYYIFQGKVLIVRYDAIDNIRQVIISDIRSLNLGG
ncbi:MAG: TlpA family protein disulfide reductase [Pseudomonadales bacterium]|jgi:thiol-disulfide isomerase/thioredoxin